MAKDTEKLIRQLSLISFLMAERRPVTALEIKQDVEGYSQMNDEAFARRFYADRDELDSLGIHLKVDKPAEGYYEAENYSLPPQNFYLPAIEFDDSELGALLHDIGKTQVYATTNGAIKLTDSGKLLGEIPLGYYMVRREIERIEGFPPADAEGLLHIILSHHGKLEHGSPVLPCTREATLVHMIDNLGGKLGSFDRLEKALPDGSAWSGYDRALGGGAYFAARQAA